MAFCHTNTCSQAKAQLSHIIRVWYWMVLVVALRIFVSSSTFSCLVIKNVSQTTEFHPEYYCSRGTHNVTFFFAVFFSASTSSLHSATLTQCVLVLHIWKAIHTNPEYPRFISCSVWDENTFLHLFYIRGFVFTIVFNHSKYNRMRIFANKCFLAIFYVLFIIRSTQ